MCTCACLCLCMQVVAVETFVEEHYQDQIQRLSGDPSLPELHQLLQLLCADEVAHRSAPADEAAPQHTPTDTHTDTHTHTQTDRQTDRHTHTHTHTTDVRADNAANASLFTVYHRCTQARRRNRAVWTRRNTRCTRTRACHRSLVLHCQVWICGRCCRFPPLLTRGTRH